MSLDLSIVVPTFNEHDNVEGVVRALDAALTGLRWEVIFVDDDSPDGTAERVRAMGRADPRVRCIWRVGRRGLSSASIEGMLAAAAPVVAVMDSDLQHDERILPEMLRRLNAESLDLVVGSRYVEGGGTGDWSAGRRRMSGLATRVGQMVIRTKLSDPMSGFFMVRQAFVQGIARDLSGQGFKILLDIVQSAGPGVRLAEVPYVFRSRQHGESKLDTMALWEYALLLADKSIGRHVPVRFILFVGVGSLGALLHLAVLGALFKGIGTSFLAAQATATALAITLNYTFNNLFTYRDRRQRGWRFARGLLVFYLVCAVGAGANLAIARTLFEMQVPWWIAGLLGAMIGAVWNYAVSRTLIWRTG